MTRPRGRTREGRRRRPQDRTAPLPDGSVEPEGSVGPDESVGPDGAHGSNGAGRPGGDAAGQPPTPREAASPPPQPPPSGVRRPHLAARLEDAVNRFLVRLLRLRGWRPNAFVYDGYGAAPGGPGPYEQGWVRVLGRVVMGRTDERATRSSPPRGWRNFVTAQVESAPVRVAVGGSEYELRADRSGVIDVVLEVALEPGWHEVVITPGEGLPSHGGIVVVDRATQHGLVSDIDDTVLVTHLPRAFIAGWNTFVLRETARTEVSGMSALYREAAERRPGMLVVYVSTGAWNTAPFLRRFLARHSYPRGPLLLTDWGPTNTGWFRSGREHKLATMRRLQAEFPGVRWLLVGDDGQHDPDLYSAIARERPEAVRAIALRRLSATEQVLSRGRADSPAALEGDGVPVVSATDGAGLRQGLDEAGLL